MNGTFEQYQQAAASAAQTALTVLAARPGTDPAAVRNWLLTRTPQGDVWLFAELDDQRIPRFEPYEAATHHLSSSLRGMPVLVSNHTGLRYAFLLSPARRLPKQVELPSVLPGRVLIGQKARGGMAGGEWGKVGHMIVAGMTGSGKSVTLRCLVYQAIKQEFALVLGDLDGATFPMLQSHPALMSPLVGTSREYIEALRIAYVETERRARLYAQAGNFPEKIDEYNHWASGQAEPLKRVLVVLDEFNSAVSDTGGPNGQLAKLAALVAWRGRKFGVSLVFAAQDFSKEVIGRVRDQVGAVIAHRARSEEVARNLGLAAAVRISENRPGRALTDRWGLVQAYFVRKSMLLAGEGSMDGLTADERVLAERAMRETDGKISRDVLVSWGMTQGQASRLVDVWSVRGWAAKDIQRANATYITPVLRDLLNNPTTPTAPNSRPTTPTTGPTTPTTEYEEAE